MTAPYRIFGNEMSPYSVKVRAWFRYKAIPHLWLQRSQHQGEFRARARLPLIPLVVTPDDRAIQDSTPIIEALEAEHPEPSIHPDDPALRFLSALIEEYGDEWGNKLMFHHRWHSEVDRRATALVLARSFLPNEEAAAVEALAEQVRERMVGRVHFTGSSEANAPLISRYLDDLLAILEAHLESRKYLFGARPAFADFGLAPQLYEAALDPTAAGIIRARAPKVLAWSYRVLEPHNEGPFESWDSLKETLTPLLANAGAYLPALVERQFRCARGRGGEFQRRPPRRRLCPGAAEIPCALADRAPAEIPGGRRRTGPRSPPRRNRLPAVSAIAVAFVRGCLTDARRYGVSQLPLRRPAQ